MDHDRANHETQRNQAKDRNTFLDYSKRAFPDHQPNHQCDWQSPPWKSNAGGKLERDTNAADLRRQDKQAHKSQHQVEKCEIVETKAFANCVWNRAPADRCEPACLFDEKDNAEATQHDGPDQLKREISAGLRGGSDRSDLQKTTHARHDAECNLQDLLHECCCNLIEFFSASRSQPANSARP